MSEMINLKSKNDRDLQPVEALGNEKGYPWGLGVELDNETIDKLGLKPGSLKVGSKVKLICEAIVTSRKENESGGGKVNRSFSLQITDMRKPSVLKSRMREGTDLLKGMRR